MIAIADTGGDVSRRYAYSAYGQPVFLRPIFVSYGGNVGEWEASTRASVTTVKPACTTTATATTTPTSGGS